MSYHSFRTSKTINNLFSGNLFWENLYLKQFGNILPTFSEDLLEGEQTDNKNKNNKKNNNQKKKGMVIFTSVREKIQFDSKSIIQFEKEFNQPIAQLKSFQPECMIPVIFY
jgi:hypothetical protein